jgi:hypothetical protein
MRRRFLRRYASISLATPEHQMVQRNGSARAPTTNRANDDQSLAAPIKDHGWKDARVSCLMEMNPHYSIDSLPHKVDFALDQFNTVLTAAQHAFVAFSLHVSYQEGNGTTQSVAAFCESMDGVMFECNSGG